MDWVPIDTRPLKTGKYLVGHAGWCEIMWFVGPVEDWVPGIQFGWHRLGTDWHTPADNPVKRLNATHCCLIEGPDDCCQVREAS